MNEEDPQLQGLERLLRAWALKISESTKEAITNALQGHSADGGGSQSYHAIFDDIRDRQSRVITTIQEAHNRQLDLLKSAISEERKEFSRAQLIFEHSLRTKYEASLASLRETINNELENRMTRTLKHLENQANLEASRASQLYNMEIELENQLSIRLKKIINDLRKAWEEEEIIRIKLTEEKLKNNYNIILEHMENQLKMSLKLQDDADEKWLEDMEQRNQIQLNNLKNYEKKCRNLYEERLKEYMEKMMININKYEEKLLSLSENMIEEREQYESKIRRIRLACCRWKMAYQSEIHQRYQEVTGLVETKYIGEINNLLEEIQELKSSLMASQRTIELKEKEIQKAHEFYSKKERESGENSSSSSIPHKAAQLRLELAKRWDEQKVPLNERIEALSSLLDAAHVTPEVLALYDNISNKLSARVPIVQLLNRKQFLEYKLKLSSRTGSSDMNLPSSEKAELITELTELKANLENLQSRYEAQYGETVTLSTQVSSPLPSTSSLSATTGVSTNSTSHHPQSLGQSLNSQHLRSFNSIDSLNLRRN